MRAIMSEICINKAMAKTEFLSAIPEVIEHQTHGYGELKITVNKTKERSMLLAPSGFVAKDVTNLKTVTYASYSTF